MATFDANNDYPDNQPPRNPPPFDLATYESCVKITTRVLSRRNVVVTCNKNVLVKTGSFRSSLTENSTNNGEGMDIDDSFNYRDDEDECSTSSSSSEDSAEQEQNNAVTEEEVVPERAYLLVRKVAKAIYGEIWHGIVLSRRNLQETWRMTEAECAIKMMSLDMMRGGREEGSAEDAEEECSTMQYLYREHRQALGHNPGGAQQLMRETNTIMQLDALYDEQYFYNVMPYIDGGELFAILDERDKFSEEEARYVVKRVLHGSKWLQRAGVCHRDMSLENLMMDNQGKIFIIDMGMCIRIPCTAEEVSMGDDHRQMERTLIYPQGRCGKYYYMSPEIYQNSQPFDGHAVDLWAVGIILFMMLTGYPCWEKPDSRDECFRNITGGYLVRILTHWQAGVSPLAMDLLQRMLFYEPSDRLSMDQVLAHPWITSGHMRNPMTNEIVLE